MLPLMVTDQDLAALKELDRRIAVIFGREPLRPRIEFVSLIDERRVLGPEGGSVLAEQVLGQCDHTRCKIRILWPHTAWKMTLIHELVHLYNPRRRERTIDCLAVAVARYFKGRGPHPLASSKDAEKLEAWVKWAS